VKKGEKMIIIVGYFEVYPRDICLETTRKTLKILATFPTGFLRTTK
jgi:hypothetical protein